MAVWHTIVDTERLRLRPYTLADAANLQRMISDREVAATTLSIPHPYPPGGAEEWITRVLAAAERGEQVAFAITARSDSELVGTIDLRLKPEHRHAELGYLIARSHWGKSFATEAADAVLRFGFETLDLNRIFAHHMTINPASGRVMQKIGMKHEGTLREHIIKWGETRDVALYGMTAAQYRQRCGR